MLRSTFHSPAQQAWWFVLYDTAGDPIIVSPAIYPTERHADLAAQGEEDHLEAILHRRTFGKDD